VSWNKLKSTIFLYNETKIHKVKVKCYLLDFMLKLIDSSTKVKNKNPKERKPKTYKCIKNNSQVLQKYESPSHFVFIFIKNIVYY